MSVSDPLHRKALHVQRPELWNGPPGLPDISLPGLVAAGAGSPQIHLPHLEDAGGGLDTGGRIPRPEDPADAGAGQPGLQSAPDGRFHAILPAPQGDGYLQLHVDRRHHLHPGADGPHRVQLALYRRQEAAVGQGLAPAPSGTTTTVTVGIRLTPVGSSGS